MPVVYTESDFEPLDVRPVAGDRVVIFESSRQEAVWVIGTVSLPGVMIRDANFANDGRPAGAWIREADLSPCFDSPRSFDYRLGRILRRAVDPLKPYNRGEVAPFWE